MLPRRAKIVCTLGPASSSLEAIDGLIAAGMDVARLNFSHGTHREHAEVIARIRKAGDARRKAVAILGDLSGPKIRLGRLGTPPRDLVVGEALDLVGGDVAVDGAVPVRYATLAEDLVEGDAIFLDDARIALRVVGIARGRVRAVVEEGGRLRDHVGVHLPSGNLQLEALTDKDKQDLMFGLTHGVDYVAVSFVRRPEDVKLVREICEAWGTALPVVAKIETPQAVERLDAIVEAADAVMVARGDLGVEFPPEQVPVLQRTVLASAMAHRRPVIVATEMLQSMVTATRPTRAEASDVASAIFAGADATMLSGETASGAHPALAVAMMARIVAAAESSAHYAPRAPPPPTPPAPFAEAIARVAVLAARDVGARLIVVFTRGGDTARLISKERPLVPVVAFSPSEAIRRRLGLLWGVTPRIMSPIRDTDEMVEAVQGHLLGGGFVSPGDKIVLVFGAPVAVGGRTNTVRVHQVS